MIMMKSMIDAPEMVLTVTTPVGEIKTERTGTGEIMIDRDENRPTCLDSTENPALKQPDCSENQMSEESVNGTLARPFDLFAGPPRILGDGLRSEILDVACNTATKRGDMSIAEGKGCRFRPEALYKL